MSLLVVGAIHHDVIIETPAIPRLDETLPGTGIRYAFGGKGGNQAVAAGRLGRDLDVNVAMVACLGSDAPGDAAIVTLQLAAVQTDAVQRVDGPTGMSVALCLPGGGYGAVTVSASNRHFDASRVELPTGLSWLVLQNELPLAVNQDLAGRARNAGAKVLLNAAPARAMDGAFLDAVDVLVVNRVEAADLTGLDEASMNPQEAFHLLRTQTDASLVLTLGGDGFWLGEREDAEFLPAHRVQVISTHGAGDAFVGALAVQLALGSPLRAAALYANAAAALHVSTKLDDRVEITNAAINAFLAQTSSP